MSTRNTKPSSFLASSRRMSSRPRRLKYSSFSTSRGPSVSPASREQEHEIDVGGEIQFAPAELAHAEHDQRHLLALRAARPAETGCKMQRAPPRRPRGCTASARSDSGMQGLASRRRARRCRATRCAAFRGAATRARCAAPPAAAGCRRRALHTRRSAMRAADGSSCRPSHSSACGS